MDKDRNYIKELEQVVFHPVFILGVHRSGTSILYQLLACTGCFNLVTAYHIISYDSLLFNFMNGREEKEKLQLTHQLNCNGVTDRGIDTLNISADFAEEYGFLLGNKTKTMAIKNRNSYVFIQLCKKIQFLANNNKPLLLKNPYDFSNFIYLKQMFPTAKFIFIHRNPLYSLSSMLNAMNTIIKDKNPYTARLSPFYDTWYSNFLVRYPLKLLFCTIPYLGGIFLSRITAKKTRYYLDNIEKLSSDDYISITYEQLCLHAQDCVESIMKKFSFPIIHSFDANTLIKPREAPLHPSIVKLRNYILKSMNNYCKKFNYF